MASALARCCTSTASISPRSRDWRGRRKRCGVISRFTSSRDRSSCERDLPVGIVTSIAGVGAFSHRNCTASRGTPAPCPWRFATTPPLRQRRLFLPSSVAARRPQGLVGTVGQLEVPHGLINVIPGRCELSLDVRAADDETRDAAIADIRAGDRANRGASRRDDRDHGNRPPSARFLAPPKCSRHWRRPLRRAGIAPFYLASGAGHDAEQFAGVTDIGMLFVRCGNGGISHSPLETVTAEDADIAARVLLDVIMNLN